MFCTVADLLTHQAGQRPDGVAVIDGATAVSYRELLHRALCCATLITRLSNDRRARVVVLLSRGVDAVAAYFAIHLAGAVAVVITDQLRPRQVAHIVGHAGASLVLTSARHVPLLRDAHIPEDRIVDVDTIAEAPLRTPVRTIGRDLAGLVYTSGSTGAPKGIMLSHDNLVSGAVIVADYLALTSRDRTLAALPWSFDYGLNQVLATFAAGGAVVIQRSTLPGDICRTLSAARVTGFAGVPSLWAAMTSPASPLLHAQFPALRYLTNTGGSLPAGTVRRIRQARHATDLFLMYGLTEAFRSTYLDPAQVDRRPTSIGRAIPNTEILVVGDDGAPCPPGAVGELVHRGPTVALGYWRDPDATSRVFRHHPWSPDPDHHETVVYSGDYVTRDDDGFLYYVGRRDDMFKSRGFRVTPSQIETEVQASGMVSEAVIIAPDGDGPLTAVVVPADHTFDVDKLFGYCRAEMPTFMQPDRIVVVAAIPTTPNGKPDRIQVCNQAAGAHTNAKGRSWLAGRAHR